MTKYNHVVKIAALVKEVNKRYGDETTTRSKVDKIIDDLEIERYEKRNHPAIGGRPYHCISQEDAERVTVQVLLNSYVSKAEAKELLDNLHYGGVSYSDIKAAANIDKSQISVMRSGKRRMTVAVKNKLEKLL
jgi:uncharacterized protein (DUF433 family)